MKPNIRPLFDCVLIRPYKHAEKTASGVLLPHNDRKPHKGEVVAVGSGIPCKNGNVRPLDVEVGDIVLFLTHSAAEINLEDEKILSVEEENIVAVVDK